VTDTPEIVHHYDAATARRGLLYHGLPMLSYPRQAWVSRTLVANFFRRELLGRFRGSLGGVFWVLVQPAFQFAVYFLFNARQEGATRSLSSIVGNANLVRKVVFPCELLPLTPILVAVTVYAVATAVMVGVGLVVGEVHLGWHTLLWPVLILCLLGFSVGLGLFLGTAQVFARDVHHLWSVLSLGWFFLSPIFWPVPIIQNVADKYSVPWLTDLLLLNPAYCLLMAQRQVFGIGQTLEPATLASYFPLSLGENLLVSAAWATVTFYFGFGFFMSRKHKFADLI
jgi:ABC-type polysaccharide/polyol phosphate export permease